MTDLDRYNERYLTLHDLILGQVLYEYPAHVGRPVAVVDLHDVGQRSRLVLDPLQFESARENTARSKVGPPRRVCRGRELRVTRAEGLHAFPSAARTRP
jgi:hypothetical protein